MARAIFGIVLGYIVILLFVMASFTVAMFAIGAERTYQPGSWEVTTLWLVLSFILGFLAAMIGGWVCARIAEPKTAPPKVLAAMLLVLGLVFAIPTYLGADEDAEAAPPRTADVSPFDAMQHRKSPLIALILNPVIGAAGVLIGASLVGRPKVAALND